MENNTELESYNLPTKLKKPAWSDEEDNDKPSMKKLLRPFLYTMALVGCYNFNDINNSSAGKRSVKSVLSNAYRTVIILLTLLFLAKSGAAFFFLPTSLLQFNGLIFAWLISVIATYFVNLKVTSSKHGHLEKAFVFWEEKIIPEFHELEIKFPTSKIKKRIAIVLVVSWLLVMSNVVALGVQMYLSGPEFFTSPFESTPATIVVNLALSAIATGLWILPAVYVIIINKLIYEAFSAYNEFGRKYCAKHGCKMSDDFQRVRLLHMNLCKLVKDLDEDLGWFYACIFTFSIGMSVFNLYQVMKTPLTTYELVLFLNWLTSQLFMSVLLASYAAHINDAAHAPLDTIYYVNVKDITVEKLAQLNLFLSKLTGTQVGFTTCGFLVITKEFILTIAGVFLTYFAVLYTL